MAAFPLVPRCACTAPGTITVPMAMNQVMRLKTTPSVPYSLLPEMIAEEKQTKENNSRPIQNGAVGTADET